MTCIKMMDQEHAHSDVSVTHRKGKSPCHASNDSPITSTEKSCMGLVMSVTTNPKSLVKAPATACSGGLTASVCSVGAPASCQPVREGT